MLGISGTDKGQIIYRLTHELEGQFLIVVKNLIAVLLIFHRAHMVLRRLRSIGKSWVMRQTLSMTRPHLVMLRETLESAYTMERG